MTGVLLAAMFLGLGAVAVWFHLRYPTLRPTSLLRAAAHVVFALVVLGLLPGAFSVLLTYVPPSQLRLDMGLALLIPTMTYFLLSWIWLVARVSQDLHGGPRGGLPVEHGAH